jgi:two-component system phosphate regulon sensor histidine kinase PhoR
MNRHQGGMAVESLEGEGATFLVYFPLSPAPAPSPSGPATTEAPLDMGVMKASS